MRLYSSARHLCGVCLFISLALAVGSDARAQRQESLDLHQALSRALEQHPALQVFQMRRERLAGLRQSAELAPALRLEAQVEEFAGSGEFRGFGGSEQTLALSSVFEFSGKRAARVALVYARAGMVSAERQAAALELAAEVTRAFVEALASQERLRLAQQALELAADTLQLVRSRSAAGAAPRAEVLRARAAHVQADLAVAGARRELASRKVKLAALMGMPDTDVAGLAGNLFQLPSTADFDHLYQQARGNPSMQAFRNEERLKQAEVELTRSQGRPDLQWRLGLRRVEETGDTGLVAGVSLPLFAGKRNSGELAAARAEREQVNLKRKEAELRLHALLYQAHTQLQQNRETVQALQGQVVPALEEALTVTRQAYETGRYSFMEWMAAQEELLNARRRLVAAAEAALSDAATIEQLTAEPVFTGAAAQTAGEADKG